MEILPADNIRTSNKMKSSSSIISPKKPKYAAGISTVMNIKPSSTFHLDYHIYYHQVMKSLEPHVNVVRLLGCCIEKEPIFVILEYVNRGKLQTYLRNSRAER